MVNPRDNLVNTLVIQDDLYKLQRRPQQGHVVVNNGYGGVEVIDPWRGVVVAEASFTPVFKNPGIISEWCLRADGGAVLVLNADTRNACLLFFEAGAASYDVACPDLAAIHDLRYLWDDDEFWLTGGGSYGFWRMQWEADGPVFRETSGMQARLAQPAWRRVVERLPIDGCKVLRVEADRSQMLYHQFGREPAGMGRANWREDLIWSQPAPGEVSRLACHDRRLFVLQEQAVQEFSPEGEVEATYPAPEGFFFVDLDTLPALPDRPAALVLACGSWEGPERNQLLVYSLD